MKYKQQLEELEAYMQEWDEELEEAEEEEIIELTPEVIAAQEKEMQNTGKALCIGIAFFNIVFLIVGNILTKGSISFTAGLLLGTLVAYLLAAHMQHTVRRAVEMESTAASGYMKKEAIFRMLFIIFSLLLAVLLPKVFHLIGVMLGVLTLKGAALLYPVTNKILFNKGE